MIRRTSILLIAILFIGCGSQKNVTVVETLPAWVQQKPVSAEYYTGIGVAQKTPGSTSYQMAAKNDALADLASEISLNISSTSVLNQFESSMGSYVEDFSAATKMATQEQLEGYELVNNFESTTHYYVYYRLSKNLHAELKEKRKAEAVSRGTDYLVKAQQAKNNLRYIEALANYVKGLEAVKAYLTESLETTYNNTTIYLGNELLSGLVKTVNDIRIMPGVPEIKVKNGASIPGSLLQFTVENNLGKSLEGLPVVFSLGRKPLRNGNATSDAWGKVVYGSMDKMESKAVSEQLKASLDLTVLSSQLTSDPMFRKMIRKMDEASGSITIRIENPVFYVVTSEINLNSALQPKIIENRVKQLLANSGYPVTENKSAADFILEISSSTKTSKSDGRMYYTDLSGTVKIFDKQQQLRYVKNLDPITGVQLNYSDAGVNAYQKLAEYLERSFMQNLDNAIK